MYCFFDLDGTIIDSTHRKAALPNGDLDLAHWIENNTPEKIAADSLLPMAPLVALWAKAGAHVVFITARVLQDADFEFFMEHGLMAHDVISRPEGCTMKDCELKEIQLRIFAHDKGMAWKELCHNSIMFDDNPSTIGRLSMAGFDVQDARVLNDRLRAA